MITIEIPRDQWKEFLRSFSGRHQGWLAQFEPSFDGESQSLKSISVESGEMILIETETHDTASTHLIRNPSRLCVDVTAEGAEAGLVVESSEGTAILRFRSAIPPELVDDVA